MPPRWPPLSFNSALEAWGVSRVGADVYSAPPASPCLLEQSPETIKERFRELARSLHPDKQPLEPAAAAAAATSISSGSSASGSSGSEEEEEPPQPDLDWLKKARALLLERLEAEQDKDLQQLAKFGQHQLVAAAKLLQQLADRRQECSKQWGEPAEALQLRFARLKRRVGQQQRRYLGVTLSSSAAQHSTTALVTRNGYILDTHWDQTDHLPPGLAFAHELISLQQACDERGWRVQQARDGSLRIRCSRRSSTAVTAQQLAEGTATVAVLQECLSAQPDSPRQAAGAAHTACTAGTAGSAPPPATAARRDRRPSSAQSQPAPTAAGPSHARVLPVAQRMMQAAATAAAADPAGAGRELVKTVQVGSAFLSHTNFSISQADVLQLLGDEWDGQETLLSAEDMRGEQYNLRARLYDEQQQKHQRRRYRCYFPRALLDSNQVRLGQRMLIWRVAGGGLQLQFEEGEPATQPSGSGSGSTAQQHSTGRKRAAPE